ncbi:MAG TPA: glycerol-3-phosphate dehydrogenase/oxidase [Anaerolineales bacterium]
MNRRDTLNSLKSTPPTVLIVGGGINGVGTFRDLTLQGVDTLLIDRVDFCSGASAASSRMAHGGIRYLENGEFRLVREAVQERNRMIQNAPSLVKPLPTTIPIFKTFSGMLNAPFKFLGWLEKPSERGGLIIKVGLIFYDAFTGKTRVVPRHVFDGRTEALKKYPHLNPGIRFAATYYDGIILSPERLTLELLLDAEKEGDHARSLNYVSLIGANQGAVILQDGLTGEKFDVRPQLIINAAGPWIDGTNRIMGMPTQYVGATKGSHLVLDNTELSAAIGDHEFFFENKDGRIVLIIPMFDKVMIGTSDLPIEDPDSARCTDEEVDYFIEMVGRVFPGIKVSRDQIVFRFSGARPLAYTKAKNAGQITRDHHIQEDKRGNIPVYSLVGGKWTSFRAFSEQATDRTLAFLSLPRKFDTKSLPIGAGKDATPIKTDSNYTRGEIAAMARREKIVHLDDLLLRRTLLAYLGQLTRPLVEELADFLGDHLDWTEIQKKREVERAIKIMAENHGVSL